MKNFSNRYIFLYITVLVVIIAFLLSLATITLQPYQKANRETEKMRQILTAAGYKEVPKSEVQPLFEKVCQKRETPSNKESYDIVCFDQSSGIVIPVNGKGLWGPIWGYVVLADDHSTIKGVFFAHKSETPGLGGEISTEKFCSSFEGKKIFDENGQFVSVKVVKGGVLNSTINPIHGVDAISGGTVTSQGVEEMLYRCLKEEE
ncbi:MAG: NADH:ubiquinone reductase (Na(+)-transporting) subunit C [Bacteroidales bacterium]|nr:NADH:ubiquinone reductase (Na(+)-transporting) subunit C [Bacteroidales bacterium]